LDAAELESFSTALYSHQQFVRQKRILIGHSAAGLAVTYGSSFPIAKTPACRCRIIARMYRKESKWSRRTFLKAVSAGAVCAISGPGEAAPVAEADILDSQTSDVNWLSLNEAAHLVREGRISPVELTQACLGRIQKFNPKLNAFITITAESALAQAREAETEIGRGKWRGPLHGIPIALKDLFDTAGVPTTAASGLFKDRIPGQDSEVVRRLKEAGAVLLGKLNMHEFAYGGSSVVSFFGPVRNPWSTDHMAGGSSGGSASAIAAGLCYAATGSDTGGSIREPSAYCGTVGLKPTYGRISTRGVIPLSWLYDHVGPMARSVTDAALMLQVLAGYDPEDSSSVDVPVPDYAGALNQTGSLRVGIPRAFFYEALHPEIEGAMNAAVSLIGKMASVREIEMPASNDTTILRAEAYAYHSENVKKHPELYQPETLKRIRAGEDVTTPAYIQARREVNQHRHTIGKVFETVDLLITPTTPVPPFTVSELLADMDNLRAKELQCLRNTRPFNILGLPTISVPCGFTKTGLPIGMQITGAPWAEGNVLRLGLAYEQQTEWHSRRPKMQV
jgi:aspartyl-tRNA(Asn)/glutamyl-tRNA(Gln) amidotransferase subunit A